MSIKYLDMFSGIGGFRSGLEAVGGFECIGYLDYYYDTFRSWADEYQYATREQKKMIICNLIKEVRIGKGYEIDIVFDMNYKQFLISEHENTQPIELKIAV